MGASFVSRTVPGTLTKNQLEEKFREIQADAAHEDGNSYSGQLNMCRGLKVVNKTFDSVRLAEEWLDENCQKWECAQAVKAKNIVKVVTQKPSFNGKKDYLVHLSIHGPETYHQLKSCVTDLQGQQRTLVPADELSQEQKDNIRRLYKAFYEASQVYRTWKNEWDAKLSILQKVEQTFTEYESLSTIRSNLAENQRILKEKEQALVQYDAELCNILYPTATEDKGEVWVIGGVCAS
jgi:hypothetical protein